MRRKARLYRLKLTRKQMHAVRDASAARLKDLHDKLCYRALYHKLSSDDEDELREIQAEIKSLEAACKKLTGMLIDVALQSLRRDACSTTST